MTQHLRIPYGILRQLCYGGGIRLTPRVNKTPPPEGEIEAVSSTGNWDGTRGSYTPATGVHIVSSKSATEIVSSAQPDWLNNYGNLGNEMYRYFVGSPDDKSLFFTCRGCLNQESGKADASRHFNHCRQLISAIEERIRRDKVCVICNKGTSASCWGIPLCSPFCVCKWRFSIPVQWMIARRFVLAADPKLLVFKPKTGVQHEAVH
jgi:hypothetical protein